MLSYWYYYYFYFGYYISLWPFLSLQVCLLSPWIQLLVSTVSCSDKPLCMCSGVLFHHRNEWSVKSNLRLTGPQIRHYSGCNYANDGSFSDLRPALCKDCGVAKYLFYLLSCVSWHCDSMSVKCWGAQLFDRQLDFLCCSFFPPHSLFTCVVHVPVSVTSSLFIALPAPSSLAAPLHLLFCLSPSSEFLSAALLSLHPGPKQHVLFHRFLHSQVQWPAWRELLWHTNRIAWTHTSVFSTVVRFMLLKWVSDVFRAVYFTLGFCATFATFTSYSWIFLTGCLNARCFFSLF